MKSKQFKPLIPGFYLKKFVVIVLAATTWAPACILPVHADDAKADAAAPSIDPQVSALVHRVADFYKGMNTVSLTMQTDLHVKHNDQSQDSTITYSVKFEKPNRIRYETITGRPKTLGICDGSQVSLFVDSLNKYRTAKMPADINQALAITTGGMSSLSLLNCMIAPDPYEMMMDGVTKASIVGSEKIDGTDTQHVRFEQKDVNWDIWFESDKTPWIRQVIPDVKDMMAKRHGDVDLAFKFTFKDGTANPTIAAADFKFVPPPGATEIVANAPGGEGSDAPHPLMNKPAPDIKLDTVGGGKFDLASHKSKDVVVLDFWATWCPPCRRSLPILAEVTKKYAGKDVQIYAVNEQEDPQKVQDFLKAQGLSLNVALDRNGDAGSAYKASAIPETVIIGKDGVVHAVHIGFSPDIKEKLSNDIDAALGAKSP